MAAAQSSTQRCPRRAPSQEHRRDPAPAALAPALASSGPQAPASVVPRSPGTGRRRAEPGLCTERESALKPPVVRDRTADASSRSPIVQCRQRPEVVGIAQCRTAGHRGVPGKRPERIRHEHRVAHHLAPASQSSSNSFTVLLMSRSSGSTRPASRRTRAWRAYVAMVASTQRSVRSASASRHARNARSSPGRNALCEHSAPPYARVSSLGRLPARVAAPCSLCRCPGLRATRTFSKQA